MKSARTKIGLLVALGGVAVMTTGVAAATPTYRQVGMLTPPAIPGANGLVHDLVYLDSASHRVYLSDDANAAIDAWDTRTNTYVGAMTGGFTGEMGLPGFDQLGPAGLLVDDLGQLWGGNGDGTVKVGNATTLKETASIVTGSVNRADEMAYDPIDHMILVTNPSDTPPFVTLIGAISHKVIGHVSFGTGVPTDSIEQPKWDPQSGNFLVSVRQVFAGDTKGEIATVNPKTLKAGKPFPLTVDCSPAGLALGPQGDAVLGCDSAPPVIVDRSNGHVETVFTQASVADQVWFNQGDGNYYVASYGGVGGTFTDPVVMVINAHTQKFVTNIPVRDLNGGADACFHAVAAGGSDNNRVYIPTCEGIHVFTSDELKG